MCSFESLCCCTWVAVNCPAPDPKSCLHVLQTQLPLLFLAAIFAKGNNDLLACEGYLKGAGDAGIMASFVKGSDKVLNTAVCGLHFARSFLNLYHAAARLLRLRLRLQLCSYCYTAAAAATQEAAQHDTRGCLANYTCSSTTTPGSGITKCMWLSLIHI